MMDNTKESWSSLPMAYIEHIGEYNIIDCNDWKLNCIPFLKLFLLWFVLILKTHCPAPTVV
jgi:hypothetical protein